MCRDAAVPLYVEVVPDESYRIDVDVVADCCNADHKALSLNTCCGYTTKVEGIYFCEEGLYVTLVQVAPETDVYTTRLLGQQCLLGEWWMNPR